MNTHSEAGTARQIKLVGIVTLVLGVLAVALPFVAGESVLLLLGLVVAAAGFLRMFWAFRAEALGKGIWKFLLGALTALAGLAIVSHPLMASGILTLVLAGYLFMDGLVEFVVSLTLDGMDGKGWLMIGGLLSMLLGCLMFFQAPFSGVIAIGVLLGVKLIFVGLVALTLGTTLHRVIKDSSP